MAKTTKRQVREVKNDCSWFDTDNARLIILCALFGVVGAHKFAMGKKGQGWLFIILDLTIIGIIVSAIWAFIDLLFLTIKKDNKPGNMIFGAFFLMFGLMIPCTMCCFDNKPTAIEYSKVNKIGEKGKYKNLYRVFRTLPGNSKISGVFMQAPDMSITGHLFDEVIVNLDADCSSEPSEIVLKFFGKEQFDRMKESWQSGVKTFIFKDVNNNDKCYILYSDEHLQSDESAIINKKFKGCVNLNKALDDIHKNLNKDK